MPLRLALFEGEVWIVWGARSEEVIFAYNIGWSETRRRVQLIQGSARSDGTALITQPTTHRSYRPTDWVTACERQPLPHCQSECWMMKGGGGRGCPVLVLVLADRRPWNTGMQERHAGCMTEQLGGGEQVSAPPSV